MVIKARPTNLDYQSEAKLSACTSQNELASPFRPRRRLMFVDKVFHGQRIYLDPKALNNVSLLELEQQIISLGGSIDKFLSKDVTYVVTDRKEIELAHSNPQAQCESNKATVTPTLSRGQSLLARANTNKRQLKNSATTARQLGIKVVEITKFLTRIKAELAKCDPNAKWTQQEIDSATVKDKSNSTKVKRLKSDFIKHEDDSIEYRPIFGQIIKRPCFNLDSTWGGCPFDKDHKVLLSSTDSLGLNQGTVDSKRIIDAEGKHSSMYKSSVKPKKKAKKKLAGPKAGYCESCNETFKDLTVHVASKTHLSFISNLKNFSSLDTFIGALPLVNNLGAAEAELNAKQNKSSICDNPEGDVDILTADEKELCNSLRFDDGLNARKVECQSSPNLPIECGKNIDITKTDPIKYTSIIGTDKMCLIDFAKLCRKEVSIGHSPKRDVSTDDPAKMSAVVKSTSCGSKISVISSDNQTPEEIEKDSMLTIDGLNTHTIPDLSQEENVVNYSNISTPENSDGHLPSVQTAIQSLDDDLERPVAEDIKSTQSNIPDLNCDVTNPRQIMPNETLKTTCDSREHVNTQGQSVQSGDDILSFALFKTLGDQLIDNHGSTCMPMETTYDFTPEHFLKHSVLEDNFDDIQSVYQSNSMIENEITKQTAAESVTHVSPDYADTIGFDKSVPSPGLHIPHMKSNDDLTNCDIISLLPEIQMEKITDNSSTIPYGLDRDQKLGSAAMCDFNISGSSLGPPTLSRYSSFKSRSARDRSSFCIDSLLSSTGPPVLEKQVLDFGALSSEIDPLDTTLIVDPEPGIVLQDDTTKQVCANVSAHELSASKETPNDDEDKVSSVLSNKQQSDSNSADESTDDSEFDVMEYNRQIARQAKLRFNSDESDASIDYRCATPDSIGYAAEMQNSARSRVTTPFEPRSENSQSQSHQSFSKAIKNGASSDDNDCLNVKSNHGSSLSENDSLLKHLAFQSGKFTRSSQEYTSAFFDACKKSHSAYKPMDTSPSEASYKGESLPQSELCDQFDDTCALVSKPKISGLDILQQISAEISESSNHSLDACLVPTAVSGFDLISFQERSTVRTTDELCMSPSYSESSRESADPCLIRNEHEISAMSDTRLMPESASNKSASPVDDLPRFSGRMNQHQTTLHSRAPFSDISNDSVSSLDNTLIAHGSEVSFSGSCIKEQSETARPAADPSWNQRCVKNISSGYHSELHINDPLHATYSAALPSTKSKSKKSKNNKENSKSRKRRRETCEFTVEPKAKKRSKMLYPEDQYAPEVTELKPKRRPVRNAAVVARVALNVLNDDPAEGFRDPFDCDKSSQDTTFKGHAKVSLLKSESKTKRRCSESEGNPSPYSRLKKESKRNISDTESLGNSSETWTASVVSGLKLKLSRGYSSGSVSSPCHDVDSDVDVVSVTPKRSVKSSLSRLDSWSVQKSGDCKLTLSSKLLKSQVEAKQKEGKKSRKRRLVYD